MPNSRRLASNGPSDHVWLSVTPTENQPPAAEPGKAEMEGFLLSELGFFPSNRIAQVRLAQVRSSPIFRPLKDFRVKAQ